MTKIKNTLISLVTFSLILHAGLTERGWSFLTSATVAFLITAAMNFAAYKMAEDVRRKNFL